MNIQQSIPRPRLLGDLRQRLDESPVVTLLGARQVGKTTLARLLATDWPEPVTVFDLETAKGQAALTTTPERVLAQCKGLVIIDEVQRLPALFTLLRPLCDAPDRGAGFLLLGSASWNLVRGVSESLAGRVQFVPVSGFSIEELGPAQQDHLWFRGGFPPACLANSPTAWDRWMTGFRQTFLERDIPGLGVTVAPATLGRFWMMLAHYHGQIWNASALARSMGVSISAINHYRDLLAGTFMARVLPPWHENLRKRQVKSPKVYLRDSGLLHHLLGITAPTDLPAHPAYGASWEGFALEQTLVALGEREAYFWATYRGAELDLLLLRHGRRWGVEFKCADAPSTTKSMHIALRDLNLEHLWVVYPGSDRYPLDDRITALPLTQINALDLTPAR